MRNTRFITSLIIASFLLTTLINPQNTLAQNKSHDWQVPELFLALLLAPDQDKESALAFIRENWEPSFPVMMIEIIYLLRDPQFTGRMISLMEEKTGQKFGYDIDKWYRWIWNNEPLQHPKYPEFKSKLYGLIDPNFAEYFEGGESAKIRLDEIRWGGVRQDGIPPLRYPEMVPAAKAGYLEDSNIVFGIEVQGDARAYPKRVLAWHEMFVDDVGGIPVAGVYCTLCGTMILFKTEHGGINHKLGTSGFLFRSNKLMYDKDTQSLWNTFWGKPVVGELADKDIELARMSVVTTTWGEWKKRHPKTKVLSLNTGHGRDYSEGAAYRSYFATDDLMFTVPKIDKRLKNKDEVLGLIFSQSPDKPTAISVEFLSKNPMYHKSAGGLEYVILTDKSGAARVYETKDIKFKSWDQQNTVTDVSGGTWTLSESKLESADGQVLYRLPSHRSFWFGWFSAYPHTELVM